MNDRGRGGGRGRGRGRRHGRGGLGGATSYGGSNQSLNNDLYGSNTSLNGAGILGGSPQNHGGQRRGGGRGGHSRGGGGGNYHGDWLCPNCRETNFSRRTDCFKCHTPKGLNAATPPRGDGNLGRAGSAGGGGGNCGRGGGRGGRGGNRGGSNPGGGGQQGGPNWTCLACGESGNFANRNQCYKCKTNKDGTISANAALSNPARSANNIDQEIMFIQLLAKAKNIGSVVEQNSSIYRRAFKMCKQLKIHQVEILITTMAKLRASFMFEEPPMIAHCKEVVDIYVDHYAKTKGDFGYEEASVVHVEQVLYYVERLLQIEWPEAHEEVKIQLSAILSKVYDLIVMSNKQHREKSNKITDMIESLEKEWTIKTKASTKESRKDAKKKDKRRAASEVSRWENATIEWLSDPKYFQANYLPKMKVPGDKRSQGVYSDKKDYFDTICRLWIGLTFEDGNKALSPKCRDRQQGATKECGTVLWQVPNGNRAEVCRSCRKDTVSYVCQNMRHRGGLCSRCCMGAKQRLMGPKDAKGMASTHIYDFTVKSVDFEGRIYLFGMDCRKPPQQQIHWKSTSRLKVSCLVAVVKVQDRNAPLKRTDRIIWAEVKQYDRDARDEFKRREGGQMVVSDLRDSKDDGENELRPGDHVVVIDCMTFVPEHIPVLKALEDLQLSTLPFNDGALLNISIGGKTAPIDFDKEFQKLSARKQRRRLSSYQDDYPRSDDDDESESDEEQSYNMPSIENLVDFMVDQSKLEPLIQIRRDNPNETSRLKQKLRDLIKKTTLDREQLKSFIETFVEPVHLTQGPPGTGKSYLGVVIVRALIMIRQAWINTCQVLEMPILVLSYKNHAIDEFLVDLVKAEGSLSLLRIGSSQNPSLHHYLEQNQRSYVDVTRKYKNTLTNLYQQKTRYQQIKDDLSPLSGHQAHQGSQPTSKEEQDAKNKASYNAATYLCNIIARVQKIESFLEKEEQDVESDSESEDSGYSDCNITNLWNDLFSARIEPNMETGHMERVGKLKLENKDIETLSERVAHYNKPVPEILFQWIIGRYPLPKCGVADCFINVNAIGVSYCYQHICQLVNEQGISVCSNLRLPTHQFFCEDHACKFEGEEVCLAVRMDPPQTFCEDHACFVCVRNAPDKVANAAEDEEPRNTCADHPLCTAMTGEDSCLNEVVPKTSYCQDHAFPI
ncbi:uncharacterized protein [Clytia hemisphaerica]|uniref:uncharacterized protein n=1 Tax=Clytia hemisphaerica TaxID=252671 RepID=UPI0034D585EB|eukprot:TCONS_00000505-protein